VLVRCCREGLRPGGLLIFDVPSALRRRWTAFRSTGWHAGTALTRDEVRALAAHGWQFRKSRGVLFFPIHRVPMQFRKVLRWFDDLVCMTPANRVDSYGLFCFEKVP